MANLILFINSFLSYFLLFALIVVLVIVACILGVKWSKSSVQKDPGSVGQPSMLETAESKK